MDLMVDELMPIRSGSSDFVFHIPTSSFYEVDGDTLAVLGALEAAGPLSEERVLQQLAPLGLHDAAEIVGDLVNLRLITPPELRGDPGRALDAPPEYDGIRNLTIHVAHTCNLACGYCYAEQGLYKGRATLMKPERAIEYVEWFFEQAPTEVPQLGITFFGGEPLLNFPVVEAAARRALELSAERGQEVRFSITTNGTLVTPEIADFLQEIRCLVTVSLDAVGKANDRLRPYHSGRGSYDIILERIRPLLDRKLAVARVTVTKINLDVVHTVHTLLDEGFREVGCSPVDAKNPAYDLDGADYARLLEGFAVLSREYVEAACRGEKHGFTNIGNILKAIHSGHNKEYPCGAGLQMVAAAPNGKMSLCHRFVGEEDYVLGSLQEGGLNQVKRREVLDAINLKERSDCTKCWARYICSGGCHHINFLFNGDPKKTYLTHCDWLRAWYRTGLEAYAEILRRNPAFISQYVDPGWICATGN